MKLMIVIIFVAGGLALILALHRLFRPNSVKSEGDPFEAGGTTPVGYGERADNIGDANGGD